MLTLILGLGNIGKKYDKTRHNLGFEVVDRVVEKLGAVRQEDGECYQWWTGEVEVQDEERSRRPEAGLAMTDSKTEDEERLLRRVEDAASRNDVAFNNPKRSIYLAKPTTYMNGSGEAAKALIERLSITPAEILVIIDDFQIPLGAVRFRPNGSDGGHNGLVSVIEEIGTQAFPRLRLGIGLPQDKAQVIDYVLTKFSAVEKPAVEKMLAIASEGVIFALQHRLEKVMSKYNFNPAPPDLA